MNILSIEGLCKRFDATVALNDVSFDLEQGSVLGLAGENGSGKSTAVKVLCGIYKPDRGRLSLWGKDYAPRGPSDSDAAGISVFHQEIPVCSNLSAAENLFLSGDMPRRNGIPDRKFMHAETIRLFDELLGEKIDPSLPMKKCSVAQRQMTLLVRALSRNARLIILDEPTTALTPGEVAKLFSIIEKLREKKISFIFISHMMEEIMELCDKVVVLRDGEKAGELRRGEYDRGALSSLIAGRTLIESVPDRNIDRGQIPLEARAFRRRPGAKGDEVNFRLHKGEILGIAGLAGSGKSTLMESLFGIKSEWTGQILMNGAEKTIDTPEKAIQNGIGYLPEDRKTQGIFFTRHMLYNLGAACLPKWSKGPVISFKKLEKAAAGFTRKLNIKSAGTRVPMQSLSGGNQQKVLLARWMINRPSIFLLNEPTRGIDVGAKQEICNLILEMSNQGYSFIIASSELEELITLSDRLIVMNKGRMAGLLRRGEISKQKIIDLSG